jgi:WD40 repeat protein
MEEQMRHSTTQERAATPTPARRFDAFLSHNSQDKTTVERVAEKLKRAGLEPWFDKWCLTPGGRWQDELVTGLRASAGCAVFIGQQGLGDWEREELGVALDRAAKDPTFRLFLVLLAGLPEPFDANSLPPFLSTRTWVDLRTGIEDSDAFQALINAIKGIPLGPQVPIEPRDDVCPYRGLQTFDEEHADLFFGRDGDIQRMLEKLKATRFLAVVGPSGSGKSSLVRAGLLPLLRRGAMPDSHSWTIQVLTPGSRPLTTLASHLVRLYPGEGMIRTLDQIAADARTLHLGTSLALAERPSRDRAVWVIDQFEEIFTLCRDEQERAQFLRNLLYAASIPDGRSTVVLTLRADFYPRCAAYPELSQHLAAQQFLVSPMDLEGLRQAIEEPARRVGLEFEHGLVATILDDVANQSGALPLLEHALLELWQRRRGRMLTLEAYEASGGVKGALAKRADDIYAHASPEQQAIARRVLLRLTQPGEGTEDTRRRATLRELVTRSEEGDAVETLVQRLVEARLLTTGEDPTAGGCWVDVSHEALIRGWPRLRSWIEEDRAGLRVHHRLTEAAHEWQQLNRDEGALYRGARLSEAVEWQARNPGALNELEREFLNASVALRERERRAAQRRVRFMVGGLVAALAVISAFALVAWDQRQAAERQRNDALQEARARATAEAQAIAERDASNQARIAAEESRKLALSREIAARSIAQLQIDPELSVLLATEAVGVARTAEAEDALRAALLSSRVRAHLRGHTDEVKSVQFSPDGRRLVTAGLDRTARIWEPTTGRVLAELHGHTGSLKSASFSPDGKLVATASFDKTARIWDVASGTTAVELHGHTGTVWSAAFSPDGGRIVTASDDKTARLWEVGSGHIVTELYGHTGPVNSAAFSPDGGLVATASDDGTAALWMAGTGELVARLRGHTRGVTSATFSPDGGLVATGSQDGSAALWDVSTGRQTAELRAHTNTVWNASFSPDGKLLATASGDGTARLWAVSTASVMAELRGHADMVWTAAFSPDGRLIATASADKTARLWDANPGGKVAELRGHTDWVNSSAFSPDGSLVVTASSDKTARLWEAASGNVVTELAGHSDVVWSAAFSPDGRWLATASADMTGRVWEAATGQLVAELRGHRERVRGVTFSPDGRLLATAGFDDTGRVWDASTGKAVAILSGHTDWVRSVAFSPDSKIVVTASEDRTVRLWEAATGRAVAQLPEHAGGVRSASFSPDGDILITGGFDKVARVWQIATGQLLAELRGHTDPVNSASFSLDGRWIVTAGDTTARVWEASTGKAVAELRGHTYVVWNAAFSPDGKLIATASGDGTAHLYACEVCGSLEDLLDLSPRRVAREFTPEERAKYLRDQPGQ